MTWQIDATSTNAPLKMRIEGMDCEGCAIEIESALGCLPGITNIEVSYGAQTLLLQLDVDRTSRASVEDTIRGLGYRLGPFPAAPVAARAGQIDAISAPWRPGKARAAIVSGFGLIVAFVVSRALPELGHLAFVAAALVGLLPVANRCMAGIDSGVPFSIETLMTVATVGAIAIGASKVAALLIFLFAVGELLQGVWWRRGL